MSIELKVIEEKSEPPLVVPSVKKDLVEKFIIVYTKDIEEDELSLLKEYGKIIMFDPLVYTNINITSLQFDYFLLDLRRKEDRIYYQQIDSDLLELYNVVSYCYSFEKFDEIHEEVGVVNIMTKFPPRQAFKVDFDRLMVQKKISKPKAALSCFKSLLRMVKGDWR